MIKSGLYNEKYRSLSRTTSRTGSHPTTSTSRPTSRTAKRPGWESTMHNPQEYKLSKEELLSKQLQRLPHEQMIKVVEKSLSTAGTATSLLPPQNGHSHQSSSFDHRPYSSHLSSSGPSPNESSFSKVPSKASTKKVAQPALSSRRTNKANHPRHNPDYDDSDDYEDSISNAVSLSSPHRTTSKFSAMPSSHGTSRTRRATPQSGYQLNANQEDYDSTLYDSTGHDGKAHLKQRTSSRLAKTEFSNSEQRNYTHPNLDDPLDEDIRKKNEVLLSKVRKTLQSLQVDSHGASKAAEEPHSESANQRQDSRHQASSIEMNQSTRNRPHTPSNPPSAISTQQLVKMNTVLEDIHTFLQSVKEKQKEEENFRVSLVKTLQLCVKQCKQLSSQLSTVEASHYQLKNFINTQISSNDQFKNFSKEQSGSSYYPSSNTNFDVFPDQMHPKSTYPSQSSFDMPLHTQPSHNKLLNASSNGMEKSKQEQPLPSALLRTHIAQQSSKFMPLPTSNNDNASTSTSSKPLSKFTSLFPMNSKESSLMYDYSRDNDMIAVSQAIVATATAAAGSQHFIPTRSSSVQSDRKIH